MYEDNDIIVVDKPAGILCLPSEYGVPSIVETVFEYVQQQQQAARTSNTDDSNEIITNSNNETNTTTDNPMISERVHTMDQMIVHRLGYDTAGLLVLAKTIPAVRALNILFRTRPTIRSPQLLPVAQPVDVGSTGVKTASVQTNTNEGENRSDAHNHNNDMVVQNYVVTDVDDSILVDENMAERLKNQMGIIRQYEVLVAGHVQPQINVTINTPVEIRNTAIHDDDDDDKSTNIDTKLPLQPPLLGSGWIHLPLMRCYEYPPYMRVSTPEQQQYLLSLDSTIVGKKLLQAPKDSLTYYEIMKYEYYQNNTSLPVTRMTLTSMTGRTHQLNVHCTCFYVTLE